MSTVQLEECANCGRVIGRLETPNVFKDEVVCAECYARLCVAIQHATPVQRAPTWPVNLPSLATSTSASDSTEKPCLQRDRVAIGGWLWLPAFGVTLAPLRWLASGGQLRMLSLQAKEQSAILNDAVANTIDPLGLLIGFGGAAFSIYVAIMFWRKSSKAPSLVIAQIITAFLLSIVINVACSHAFRMRWDLPALLFGFGFQVLIGGVSIWYFLSSKRVERTFVNR